jgi:hypothetical protein
MTAQYQRYPMVMRHPSESPAIVSAWNEKTRRHEPEHGQPARFQPVTVNSQEQEEQYIAKGYQPTGDAEAFEQAVFNVEPAGYEFQEYPKWVGEVLVHSREEEDELQANPAGADDKPTSAEAAKSGRQSLRERTRASA